MSQTQTHGHVHAEAGRVRAEPGEAERIFDAAEGENDSFAVRDAVTGMTEPETTAGDGQRIRRAFTMKNFLPVAGNHASDWIMANVTAKGAGTHVLVGRVYGIVYEVERKTNRYNDKGQDKELQSIALSGDLQAENLQGQKTTFDMLFLPMAFATQVARAIAAGAYSVEIDVDVGIEATGKPIPYEWTVTSYLSGRSERHLRNMANSRRIGSPAAVRHVVPRVTAENGAVLPGMTIEGDGTIVANPEPIGAEVDAALQEGPSRPMNARRSSR